MISYTNMNLGTTFQTDEKNWKSRMRSTKLLLQWVGRHGSMVEMELRSVAELYGCSIQLDITWSELAAADFSSISSTLSRSRRFFFCTFSLRKQFLGQNIHAVSSAIVNRCVLVAGGYQVLTSVVGVDVTFKNLHESLIEDLGMSKCSTLATAQTSISTAQSSFKSQDHDRKVHTLALRVTGARYLAI